MSKVANTGLARRQTVRQIGKLVCGLGLRAQAAVIPIEQCQNFNRTGAVVQDCVNARERDRIATAVLINTGCIRCLFTQTPLTGVLRRQAFPV